jgi:hypothetical protein
MVLNSGTSYACPSDVFCLEGRRNPSKLFLEVKGLIFLDINIHHVLNTVTVI